MIEIQNRIRQGLEHNYPKVMAEQYKLIKRSIKMTMEIEDEVLFRKYYIQTMQTITMTWIFNVEVFGDFDVKEMDNDLKKDVMAFNSMALKRSPKFEKAVAETFKKANIMSIPVSNQN